MLKTMLKILLKGLPIAIPALASQALATGGWIGGGGELVKDSANPWFLQNTEKVSYCILQDESHFHIAPALAARRVRDAINYWKEEFSRANTLKVENRTALVATQDFQQVNCSQSGIDIVFQLGELSADQLQFIKDPTELVGLTIRTSYDRVHLRGRGFIYVAPDSGPFKSNSDRMVDAPWSLNEGGLLLHVLAHELGHVFGIQHTNDQPVNTGSGLMSPAYPEYILDRDWAENIAQAALPNYLIFDGRPVDLRNYCSSKALPESVTAFWGMPPDSHCWLMEFADGKVIVKAGSNWKDSSDTKQIGVIELSNPQVERTRIALSVWLPKEQIVFPQSDEDSSYYAYGPTIAKTGSSGIYKTDDGRVQRSVRVNYPLNELQWPPIYGEFNGRVVLFD